MARNRSKRSALIHVHLDSRVIVVSVRFDGLKCCKFMTVERPDVMMIYLEENSAKSSFIAKIYKCEWNYVLFCFR